MDMKITQHQEATATRALNKQLYLTLVQLFGNVRVTKQGQSQLSHTTYNLESRTHRQEVSQWGENYAVSCPFCSDTRYRLHISHLFGTPDDFGKPQIHLAKCYNDDNCLKEWTNREKLFDMVTGYLPYNPVLKPGKRQEQPSDFVTTMPGQVIRLDKLSATHPANSYLASRGYNTTQLGRFYNVHYCEKSDRRLCHKRIIIPIYKDRKLRGYQARYVGEQDWKSPGSTVKYYTCPGTPVSQLLYNYGNASKYKTGVFMEGVTDVWSLGPMGMAVLGANISLTQRKMILSGFSRGSAVLCLDPEELEKEKHRKFVSSMQGKFKHGFCAVKLPEGVDPGSLDRQTLRNYISGQAKEQGCSVSWSRW